jgi:uncharacterized iron-regulated membrane protein
VFRPDPTLTHVPATRDQVVAVIESINQPQVSIPGKQPQAVQAHLVGLRNANGTFSLYVGLFLPHGGENVVYAHDRREIPVEAYREVEAEGLHFLESMGFMLDNVNYRNLAPEAQEQIFGRVPLFSRPRPAPRASSADTKTSPRAALARLLAGF